MKTIGSNRTRPKAASARADNSTKGSTGVSRRKFMLASGAVAAFSIVPRHVLGGPGFVAPSEKITLAHIGCGTQGLRELVDLLAIPEIQVVAACDPTKDSHSYLDWSSDGLRSAIGEAMGKPDWRRGVPGVPGGRDDGGQYRMIDKWVVACKGGPATPGDFLFGVPISDAFNLAAVSLRMGGKKLVFDASSARVTNVPEANRHLSREYRPGWELQGS